MVTRSVGRVMPECIRVRVLRRHIVVDFNRRMSGTGRRMIECLCTSKCVSSSGIQTYPDNFYAQGIYLQLSGRLVTGNIPRYANAVCDNYGVF